MFTEFNATSDCDNPGKNLDLPAAKAFPIPPKLNMPGAYPPKEALPNRPPMLVPGIPNAAAPINAALPTSDDAIFLTVLVTPLTAFLTPLKTLPKPYCSLGTAFIMPPPMYNCLFICPLDIVII